MKQSYNRRKFIKSAAIAGIGIGVANATIPFYSFGKEKPAEKKRIGIIGLDTSHSVAFVKALNDPAAGPQYQGYKVVAAYPQGSLDIKTSVDRIPGYTEDVKKQGVEIVKSIQDLLKKVDFVLLETNDGRVHLEQALLVMKAGKTLFIDKPIAASLADTISIFDAGRKYKVPVFCSSSLRFTKTAQEVVSGKYGKVSGADTYSPYKLEKNTPGSFLVWSSRG